MDIIKMNERQQAWLLDILSSAAEDDEAASDDEKMDADRRKWIDSMVSSIESIMVDQ